MYTKITCGTQVKLLAFACKFSIPKKAKTGKKDMDKYIQESNYHNSNWTRGPLNLSISIKGGKEVNWESLSNGEWTGKSSSGRGIFIPRCPVWIGARFLWLSWCLLEYSIKEGENPVKDRLKDQNGPILWVELFESATRSWRYVSPKANYKARPIANKYREGKLKSTLKREWKVRETVEGELEWVLTNLMPWFILGNLVTML